MGCITIRDLYEWAVANNVADKELVTIHSYDFNEDIGLQTWNKIAGREMYIEWADEATAARYRRYANGEEEPKEKKDDNERVDDVSAESERGE